MADTDWPVPDSWLAPRSDAATWLHSWREDPNNLAVDDELAMLLAYVSHSGHPGFTSTEVQMARQSLVEYMRDEYGYPRDPCPQGHQRRRCD